jgi:major membrane immunogen (membrane-anchored lipoprotein)
MPGRPRRSGLGVAGRVVLVAAGFLVAALNLSACGYSGSPSTQLRAWAQQNTYTSDDQQVIDDIHSLELAAAKGSALQLRTVCGGLASDTGTLYTILPAPNQTLTRELGNALQELYDAAESCSVAGSTTSNAVHTDLAHVAKAVTVMNQARSILVHDGVSSPRVTLR